ncbi:unnamed protein product [Mytilus coruscus]|uniref:B box-type domain-containing protein n=1 Tax=Mytilus coruscus TaxID=42192 RepID=A0A6J8E0C4_MYTCO|nr:unnamed protein product [Mytilus coruscus]
MAFSKSLQKGQIPVGCELCDGRNKIEYKCLDCGVLMCSKCKDKVHSRFKSASEHKVKRIQELGQYEEVDTFNFSGNMDVQHNKIELKVSKQFTTKLSNVHHIERCPDGTLWMYDCISEKIQHIKFDSGNIQIVLAMDIDIFGMVVMNACNNLLIVYVAGDKTALGIINSTTGQITDSNYDLKPNISLPECVHMTNDHRVIVGVGGEGTKTAVIVMSQDGRHLATYEQDSKKEPLFTCPRVITSTKNGNISVVDEQDSDVYRVMVLGKEGDIKQVYNGHPTINKEEKLFLPNDMITTPADNIVIPDLLTSTLHILNCEGKFIGYYNLYDIRIIYPSSLALSTEGHMYIGCSNKQDSPATLKGKLYELEYSGF